MMLSFSGTVYRKAHCTRHINVANAYTVKNKVCIPC